MNSNKIKTVIVVFGLTLFISNSSFGQSGNKKDRKKPPSFSKLLEKMDANEDGKLSKAEIKGPLKENFDEVDANEDGFISEKEFEKVPKPKRRKKNK